MKEKPKYNMWQNTAFLFRCTHRYSKSLFLLNFCYFLLYIIRKLLELFVAPSIVGQLEQCAALPNLIVTILSFTVATLIVSCVDSFVNFEKMESS